MLYTPKYFKSRISKIRKGYAATITLFLVIFLILGLLSAVVATVIGVGIHHKSLLELLENFLWSFSSEMIGAAGAFLLVEVIFRRFDTQSKTQESVAIQALENSHRQQEELSNINAIVTSRINKLVQIHKENGHFQQNHGTDNTISVEDNLPDWLEIAEINAVDRIKNENNLVDLWFDLLRETSDSFEISIPKKSNLPRPIDVAPDVKPTVTSTEFKTFLPKSTKTIKEVKPREEAPVRVKTSPVKITLEGELTEEALTRFKASVERFKGSIKR